jgi:hypothetical protein
MKKSLTLVITVVLASNLAAFPHADERKSGAVPAAYPATFLRTAPELQRFADPEYFRMLAADGLRSVDPKILYQRIAAATQAGEGYKALYLSRLFTELQPNNQAGWNNRAQLATAVGFDIEAAAARANASSGAPAAFSGGALPGAFKVRPTTLADWAAALAMAADDTAAREGRAVVLAVRDDLSGVNVASNEEIQREARGPWATAKPVQLEHVLTNLFALTDATPMDKKSMKGGRFALGALAMAGSAYSSYSGMADTAAALSELSGNLLGQSFEVASELKGGQYVAVTYVNGSARSAVQKPKTSGKREAVGTPLTMLWASGGSLTPAVPAVWRNGDSNTTAAIKIDAKTTKQEWKKYQIGQLFYPRMQQFCDGAGACSPMLTLLEVMLSAEDLRAFAPSVESRLPNIASWASRYATNDAMTVAGAGQRHTGFDASGVVYTTQQRPTEWLVTMAAASNAKK